MNPDPHRLGAVRISGAPIEEAVGAVILLHGRGGSAEDILSLACPIKLPELTYVAPQAAGKSWYPNSFLAPIDSNQPWLLSALDKVQSILDMLHQAGIGAERVAIGGFSQGACLATEFVASHPRRYAGLFALTGGLIGPPGGQLTDGGDLAGTPAFFGSSDPDPHVPWSRVQESARTFEGMGADVKLKRYEHRAHTISSDEIEVVHQLLHDAFFASY
jgi:phospholipase/carboxylesterase